jgi:lipoprotein-anchoring transpeptidase ErfK/SrfK
MALIAAIRRWRPGARTWVLTSVAVVIMIVISVLALTTVAWGDTLREEGRLLPGTVIASVDVGDLTAAEAADAVEEQLEEQLDRPVVLVHGEDTWETTPRELGATTDVDDVVAEALERTSNAGLRELARVRFAGDGSATDLSVSMGVPDEEVASFVDAVAEDLDRTPRDAVVEWTSDGLELAEHRDGRTVLRDEVAQALQAALDGEADEVEVLTEEPAPEITTADATDAVDTLGPAIAAALDHEVTATLDGSTWSTSPRELDARPNLDELLATAYADGPDAAVDELSLEIPNESLAGFVASIASEVDVAGRDAEAKWTGSGLEIVEERTGLALARDKATSDLRDALHGESARVELTQNTTRPSITADSLDRVLLLKQGERRVYLYENGEPVRDWPVAVGLAGSPTPTGTFTVGAKRYEPVWVNPAPDRWGADMPERIGPGPENPLGTRAINWNKNGADTLIRFHGTPNEDSIGEAASQGCVRMFNEDVEELYDLTSTGMVIVSAA